MIKHLWIYTFTLLILLNPVAQAADESRYDPFIIKAAETTGVSPHLIKAVIKQESHFREDIANGSVVSSAGAIGLMQLIPSTAEQMGYTSAQMKDPETNIMAGAKYLKYLMNQPYIGNDIVKVLAAYNAGPGAVKQYSGVPPYKETVPYVKNAATYYADYAGIPALDTSSVPTPTGSLPGGGKGSLPSYSDPAIATSDAAVLSSFENALGLSATTLNGLLSSLVGAIALIFLALQILFLWKHAVYGQKADKEALMSGLWYTLRTFFIVIILFQFVTT